MAIERVVEAQDLCDSRRVGVAGLFGGICMSVAQNNKVSRPRRRSRPASKSECEQEVDGY